MFLCGMLLSCVGLFGLVWCIIIGFKIKRLEKSSSEENDYLRKELAKLTVLNTLSLSSSMFGLILITITLILY